MWFVWETLSTLPQQIVYFTPLRLSEGLILNLGVLYVLFQRNVMQL